MKTIEVKTNIMCGSCIAKITPALNEKLGGANWKVDILHPHKTLRVLTDSLTVNNLINVVEKAGYKAEKIA